MTSFETNGLRNVTQITLLLFLMGAIHDQEWYASSQKEIYDLIRSLGGEWNDSKERPIVCIIKSNEIEGLYYAVPVGNYEHRNEKSKKLESSII